MSTIRRCSECGSGLWSVEASKLGYHPECREPPLEGDLEDRLDKLFQEESPD